MSSSARTRGAPTRGEARETSSTSSSSRLAGTARRGPAVSERSSASSSRVRSSPAATAPARRACRRAQPRGGRGARPVHRADARATRKLTVLLVEHHMNLVMGDLRPRLRPRLRQEDRGRDARRGAERPGRDRGLPGDDRRGGPWRCSSCATSRRATARCSALHGVSLGVEEGEVVAVLGANGAGKTTTLRADLGHRVDHGEVRFDGKPLGGRGPSGRAARRRARPRGPRASSPSSRSEENLRLGAYVRRERLDRRRATTRVLALLPVARDAAPPAGRDALRRRAADARARPRADAPAPAAPARRAVARARAARRRGRSSGSWAS